MNLECKIDGSRYAVLILAHKNEKQVKRLITRLKHPQIDIFVHCDKRWEIGYRYLIKEKYENVYFTDNRVESDLDTWGLVEAPMNLIHLSKEIALSKNEGYKYYILLSGQDYPLISCDRIIKYLEKRYPKPFIDCTPYDENNWIYYKFRNTYIFDKWSKWVNKKISNRFLRKIVKLPVYLINRLVINKISTPQKELDRLGVEIYGGSAWWILPDKVIDYIIDEYVACDKYIDILSKTYTPEETFFQIMTMRSKCAEFVEINPKDMVLQNCKTYAWFFDADKPFVGHPYVFTMNDLDKLKEIQTNFFFARKFDETVDNNIFEWIDEKLSK